MSIKIKQWIDPLQLARSGQRLSGYVPVVGMERLEHSLYGAQDCGLVGNGLVGNGLVGNGLAGNGLADNGLLGNGLPGNAEYDLKFDIDSSGQANVTGYVVAKLNLPCQRCMGKVLTKVKSKVALGIVSSYAEAERLLDIYEPLVVDDSQVKFGDIVEDELLLALPLIALHSEQECLASKNDLSDNGFREIRDEVKIKAALGNSVQKRNPFAVLKKLKSD